MDGADAKDLGLKAEKRRHEERLREIEKVKQQREQREREKMEKEEEREIIAREEALIEAVELEKREEQFHLDQAKARAEIRLREGRGRPIDLLSRNLHADPRDEGDGPGPRFDHSVRPLEMFENLTLGEMEELRSDLDAYLDLDAEDPEKRRFWAAPLPIFGIFFRHFAGKIAQKLEAAPYRLGRLGCGRRPHEKRERNVFSHNICENTSK